ncbi:MAG: hypothetical protein R3C14_41695 [Caldilineaceae bacterium]
MLYQAFGLKIHSEFMLPELTPATGVPDVTIRRTVTADALPAATAFPAYLCSPQAEVTRQSARQILEDSNNAVPVARPFLRSPAGDIYLYWPEVGRARVTGGCEIAVQPEAGVDEALVRLHILGSALGVLLQQRDLLPLHASVVAIGDYAVAFMGEWGAGKSTMAAAMHGQGYPLLADDIAAIDLAQKTPYVRVGFPQLKLWPEAVTLLDDQPETLPRVHPEEEKRIKMLAADSSGKARPLRCIYVLTGGEEIEIAPRAPRDAFFDLLADWYGARFGNDFLAPSERKRVFSHCLQLTQSIPIVALMRPSALELLPAVVQAVAAHAGTLALQYTRCQSLPAQYAVKQPISGQ